MRTVKRINQRIDYAPDDIAPKRKKQPTKPPKTASQAERIIDELYQRNPLLALTASMSALTGLRYSDASWLKFSDFRNEFGQWKESFDVCQQKTFNMRLARGASRADAYRESIVRIYLNDAIKEIVDECKQLSCSTEFLFANSRSSIRTEEGEIIHRPMDIRSANYHHEAVRKKLKLDFAFGTHSWRKYFAKKLLNKNGVTLDQVRDCLGQSSLTSTNHYLVTFDDELSAPIGTMHLFE